MYLGSKQYKEDLTSQRVLQQQSNLDIWGVCVYTYMIWDAELPSCTHLSFWPSECRTCNGVQWAFHARILRWATFIWTAFINAFWRINVEVVACRARAVLQTLGTCDTMCIQSAAQVHTNMKTRVQSSNLVSEYGIGFTDVFVSIKSTLWASQYSWPQSDSICDPSGCNLVQHTGYGLIPTSTKSDLREHGTYKQMYVEQKDDRNPYTSTRTTESM